MHAGTKPDDTEQKMTASAHFQMCQFLNPLFIITKSLLNRANGLEYYYDWTINNLHNSIDILLVYQGICTEWVSLSKKLKVSNSKKLTQNASQESK